MHEDPGAEEEEKWEFDEWDEDEETSDKLAEETEQPDVPAAPEKELERLETLKEIETANYRLLHNTVQKLIPALKSDFGFGVHVEELKKTLTPMLKDEGNKERREKIQEILKAEPTADRKQMLEALIALYKDAPAKQESLKKLLPQLEKVSATADLVKALERGEAAATLLAGYIGGNPSFNKRETLTNLMKLLEADPAKRAILADEMATFLLKDLQRKDIGNAEKQRIINELKALYKDAEEKPEGFDDVTKDGGAEAVAKMLKDLEGNDKELGKLYKQLEQENYQNTLKVYTAARDYLSKVVPAEIYTLGHRMMAGTATDTPFLNRFPEGCPIKLPQVQAGDKTFAATWDGFLTKVRTGEIKLELPEDPKDLIKDRAKLADFSNAANWFMKVEEVISRNQRLTEAAIINDRLKQDFGVPKAWEMPPITDTRGIDAWFSAAFEMNNLMSRVRNYAQCYIDLRGKAPDIGDPNAPDSAINQLRAIGADIEWDPKSGRITKISLPMPKDLNLQLPENKAKVEALEKWLKDHCDPVDKACEAFMKGRTSFIRYGDFFEPADGEKKPALIKDGAGKPLRIENYKGEVETIWHKVGDKVEVLHKNHNGKFISALENGKEIEPPKSSSEQKIKFDYSSYGYTTEEKDGKIHVKITRMLCQDGKANYLQVGSEIDSMVGSSLTQIGEVTETQVYEKNDYVPVVHNVTQRAELLRADDLGGWHKFKQKFVFHYGGKVATFGMDLGMLISGGAEVLAAKSVMSVGLGALRFTIGATGFLTPALRTGAFDDYLPTGFKGKDILHYRHLAMMVDVYVLGLGGGALRLFTGGGKALAETGSMLEKIAKVSHFGTNVTGFLYAPMIYSGISSKVQENAGNLTDQRVPQAIDHRGLPEKEFRKLGQFDFTDPVKKQAAFDMLKTYCDSVTAGTTDAAVKERVAKLYDEAKEVLALPADNPKRKALVEKLVGLHRPSGDEILLRRMQQNPRDYTDRLVGLRDKDDKTPVDEGTNANRKFMSDLGDKTKNASSGDVSEQEKIAAAQLLLLLASDKDGTLPAGGALGTRKVTIPAHKIQYTKDDGGASRDYKDVAAREEEQTFSVDDALAYLKKQVAINPDQQIAELRQMANWRRQDEIAFLKSIADNPDYATSELRKKLPLTTEKADELITKLKSTKAEESAAAAAEINKMLAERCPANKYLRQQFGMSVDDAEKMLSKVRANDATAIGELKTKLDVSLASRHLSAADPLWRMGKLTDREMASLCVDLLNNKNLPDDLRMKALFDKSSPRLAILLNQLRIEEREASTKSAQEQTKFWGGINGSRVADIEKLLVTIAGSDGERVVKRDGVEGKVKDSADLRAACALTIQALKEQPLKNGEQDTPQKAAERAQAKIKLMQSLHEKYTELSGKKNAFAEWAVKKLTTDLELPVTTGAKTDEVKRAKVEAATLLTLLGKVELPDGKTYSLDPKELNKRLLECITVQGPDGPRLELDMSNPEITIEVLRSLKYNELTVAQRSQLVDLLSTPCDKYFGVELRDVELAKSLLCKNLPELLGRGATGKEYDDLRASARVKLESLFDRNHKAFAGRCPELKVAALNAIKEIGWSDARMREFLEARLAYYEEGGQRKFHEPNAGARRAALEALYRINPVDPGEVASKHRDVETDPLVGRIAQEKYRDSERIREMTPAEKRKMVEDAQELSRKLLEPFDGNTKEGEDYIKNTGFKNLLEGNLDEAIRTAIESVYGGPLTSVSGSLKRGQYRMIGLSFGIAWDRISNLSWSEPENKMNAEVAKVWKDYAKLSLNLCREAEGGPGANEDTRRKAIKALAWLLEKDCEGCLDDDKNTIRKNCAYTLANLCGRTFTVTEDGKEKEVVVPDNFRYMAFIHVRNLLNDPKTNPEVQLILLSGVKTLLKDGAIDTTTAAKITEKVLRNVIESQKFYQDGVDRANLEKLHKQAFDDMLQYRSRYPEAMAVITACAGEPGHPYKEVKEQAAKIRGLLTEGVTLTREDVRRFPDQGTTPADRAAGLEAALKSPAGKDPGDKDKSIKNENLVREIFRATSGLPIMASDDPRLTVLMRIARTTDDPRVKAAIAHALVDVQAPDGKAQLMGFRMLLDIKNNDKTVRGTEAAERLALIDKWAGVKGKDFLALLNRAIDEEKSSVTAQLKVIESSTAVSTDANVKLKAMQGLNTFQLQEEEGKKPNGMEYAKAIVSAWSLNGFNTENEILLRATRQTLQSTKVEEAKLAAAYAILKAKGATKEDLEDANRALKFLSESGSTAQIKKDAAAALDPKSGENKADEALAKSAAEIQKQIGNKMTEAEFKRADIDTKWRYIDNLEAETGMARSETNRLTADIARLNAEVAHIKAETMRIIAETEAMKKETDRINRMLSEGVALTWDEVQKSTDEKMSAADRIARFEEALKNPGANNDALVRAIFQMTAKMPITDDKDPRLGMLLRLAHTTRDTRVQDALAWTLLTTKTKNPDVMYAGAWLFADLAARGKEGQQWEAREILGKLAARSDDAAKKVEGVYKHATERVSGAVWTFKDAEDGPGRQPVLKGDDLTRKIAESLAIINDSSIPARFRVRAFAEAWAAGDFKDPTGQLRPLARKLLQEPGDEQMKIAAAYALIKAPEKKADYDLLEKVLGEMKTTARIDQVKEEAKMMSEVMAEAKALAEQGAKKKQEGEKKALEDVHKKLDDIQDDVEKAKNGDAEARKRVLAQLEETTLQLERVRLKLPVGTSKAEIEKAIRAEVGLPETATKDEVYKAQRAKRVGLGPTATEEDIRKGESKKHFEDMCRAYKLDPKTATDKDLKEAQDKASHRTMCIIYKVDPDKTTPEQLRQHIDKLSHERECKDLGLDPSKATKDDVRKAYERRDHERTCKDLGLDPDKATKKDIEEAYKKKWRDDEATRLGLPKDASDADRQAAYKKKTFEDDCKYYKLDPRIATQRDVDQAKEKAQFRSDCIWYKLDPEKATKEDLQKAKDHTTFVVDCRTYGLDPDKSTKQDLENAKAKKRFEWDCQVYKLDPKTATPAELHKAKCKAYGLKEDATEEDLKKELDRRAEEGMKRWKEQQDRRKEMGFEDENEGLSGGYRFGPISNYSYTPSFRSSSSLMLMPSRLGD